VVNLIGLRFWIGLAAFGNAADALVRFFAREIWKGFEVAGMQSFPRNH
jgi:hypothetical protein